MYFVDIYYICNMKLNYKNDFDFILKLATCIRHEDGTCEKRDVGWPEHDWVATFWTANKANVYDASRKGDTLVNCFNDNGRIHVVFNNHRLGKGVLRVDFHSEIPNAIYPDGIQDLYEPQPLDIELVDGPGDCAGAAEVEVLLPYIKGDRGEKLTYGDLTAQDKEDLIAPIKENIDKAITGKQDELSVTADFDLTENLLSLTDIGKRRLFIDLWTAAGRYIRDGKTVNGSGYDLENAPDTLHPFYTGINGRAWLTYEEAVDIYTHYTPLKTSNAANMYADYPFKATLPVVPHPSGEAVSAYMMFRSAANIEVAVLRIMATNCAFMFADCHRLRKIDGYIFCPKADYYAMFLKCYELEEVNLEWVSKSISFADSPKLKRSVFEYMLKYASNGITITVHKDVYAKLTGDTTNEAAAALTEEELAQWVAITEAAAAKNISFATV